ncbi:type II toxin-antitoxin system RelE/ParE family toxin [Secundilactobacillus mixtipabuli]|uniref:Plasmid stabilization system protein n=1 Tax=Secundilactobacillus mixtipabuli TaxID=1435342 RepID=A0A1Z5I8Y2_9LACO|nr:type II toxin-antitoxin system RelE/ParE family toxin [Secundilactobacillus mixtipabuli]GAW98243.1 plasmid stabilization system protein [Secundilactobacillus mixtipabuli]
MSYKLAITNDAASDLHSIQEYLTEYFGQKTAEKSISKMIAQLQKLEAYPKMGTNAGSIDHQLEPFRYLRDKRNTVFYKIDEGQQRIIIERIFDNRENIIRELNDYFDINISFDDM